jgi:hypothetical protein
MCLKYQGNLPLSPYYNFHLTYLQFQNNEINKNYLIFLFILEKMILIDYELEWIGLNQDVSKRIFLPIPPLILNLVVYNMILS